MYKIQTSACVNKVIEAKPCSFVCVSSEANFSPVTSRNTCYLALKRNVSLSPIECVCQLTWVPELFPWCESLELWFRNMRRKQTWNSRSDEALSPVTVTQACVDSTASARLSPAHCLPLNLACGDLSTHCLMGADSKHGSPDCGEKVMLVSLARC